MQPDTRTNQFNKDDDNKIMLSLIEPMFIEGIGKVLTDGGKQYGFNNWKTLPSSEKYRYKDALLRHIYTYLSGDLIDDKSHESHLLHVACNCMFLYYMDNKPNVIKN